MKPNKLLINPNTTRKANLQQENPLLSIALKYYLYWQLFLISLMVFGIGILLYLQCKVPVYEGKIIKMIKDEQKGLDDVKMIESFNAFTSKKNVENEFDLIKFQSLACGIVKNLHLYTPVGKIERSADYSAYITSPVQIITKYLDLLKLVENVYFTFFQRTRNCLPYSLSYDAVGKYIFIGY